MTKRNYTGGNRGGRGNRATEKARNLGVSVSPNLLNSLQTIPAIASGEMSKSYFVEQALRVVIANNPELTLKDLRELSGT